NLEQVVGPLLPSQTWLSSPEFMALASDGPLPGGMVVHGDMWVWQSFWLVPLHSTHTNGNGNNGKGNDGKVNNGTGPLIGVRGIWARSAPPDLLPEEEAVFKALYTGAARVLDGLRLQEELFATAENVLQETSAVQYAPDPVRYGNAAALARSNQEGETLPEQD